MFTFLLDGEDCCGNITRISVGAKGLEGCEPGIAAWLVVDRSSDSWSSASPSPSSSSGATLPVMNCRAVGRALPPLPLLEVGKDREEEPREDDDEDGEEEAARGEETGEPTGFRM